MSKTDELRATFFQESEDLLEGLADGLEELVGGANDPEIVNSIFRAVHSIKGGAAAFALNAVVEFAHRYENVLDALRNGHLELDPAALDILMRAADHLNILIEAARDELSIEESAGDGLLNELGQLTGDDSNPNDEPEIDFAPMVISLDDVGDSGPSEITFEVHFAPKARLFSSGNEAGFLLRELCALGEATVTCNMNDLPDFSDLDPKEIYLSWDVVLKTDASESAVREVFEFVDQDCELSVSAKQEASSLPELSALPELPPEKPIQDNAQVTGAAPKAEPAQKQAQAQPVASTIRVELHRLDRMINLVGELVINQAMLSQCVKRADIPSGSDIDVGLEELRTLTRQIQDSVMSIRAQPVKTLFQRMSRIAREAGGDVGKTLRLVTEGAATEIDKTVIEKLADPLTHMIRNAVDHGVESPDGRKEAGKDPSGTIRLSAAHLSGRVVIEISDDGAGINREKVRSLAEEKGLIAPEAQLTPNEVDNLIFLPGFSTASTLSSLSGRGVGMDVVKRSIQSLGGRVSISSVEGEGSTFTIVLPLTLAVLDGMVIQISGQTVVMPISTIVETMRIQPGQVFELGTNSAVVRIRGNYVPIVDVGAVLGYRTPVKDPENRVFLLVETAEGARAALLIDGIVDQRQVVIKGLEENYGHVQGVAAATILGDGRIALILDPSAIVAAAGTSSQPMDLPPSTLAAAE